MVSIQLYIDAFLKPAETFAAEGKNSDLGKAAINYAIAGLLMAVVSLPFSVALNALVGKTLEGIISGVISIFIYPIILPIFAAIGVGISFVLAKLLGGKGSFTSLYYLISTFYPAVGLLSGIPIVSFLVSLYSLYLQFLAIKESQSLSTSRAALVVLIPLIIIAMIVVVALILFIGVLGFGTAAAFNSMSAP